MNYFSPFYRNSCSLNKKFEDIEYLPKTANKNI